MSQFAHHGDLKLKLNQDLMKYKKGTIIEFQRLQFHEQVFFNERLKDSETDNCVEVVDAPKKNKKGESK